jgi:hypothetical protein
MAALDRSAGGGEGDALEELDVVRRKVGMVHAPPNRSAGDGFMRSGISKTPGMGSPAATRSYA